MRKADKIRYFVGLTALAIMLWFANDAHAIILHPSGEPDGDWAERPADDVIGRWGTNASCVAVSPWHVITTRHQGGSAGTVLVEIGGHKHAVLKIWNHPTADVRIARVDGRLGAYVPIYSKMDEVGQLAVIAGFGDGRSGNLTTDDVVYGYLWDNSTNTVLRFGTNLIEFAETTPQDHPLRSEVLGVRFDDPNTTPYECAVADHDSGGGWFVNPEGKWKLAALSRGVEHIDESWFRDPQRPDQLADPDFCHGVRLSKYTEWLYQTISNDLTQTGDFNGDRTTNSFDFVQLCCNWLKSNCTAENAHCDGCDADRDGNVNIADLIQFASQWLTVSMEPQ